MGADIAYRTHARVCATCDHWHAHDSVLRGECRRHAPPCAPTALAAYARWPLTQSTDRCGEHRPREGEA